MRPNICLKLAALLLRKHMFPNGEHVRRSLSAIR